eukprot:CAMPEP_0197640534 /NCGR_PEP_ID=MMETSP1338-20131121/14794_1 /TAXON_ID=43686 ORGANISM="Pelagodinium beii, Strain RCC1491" /NCGR_SAMPLE_ID=MMETSP1338 /ASSEMBLY_ACC=CAM_ASM_000754 /LENGTH=140 /DNA_ID=CAMNT_0043213397 /DNA_START=47 /DNA_END=465 /DNA_ORIENTATION=+
MRSYSSDWPLSQAEKRGRVLQLYDKDVKAAEALIRHYAEQLEDLRAAGGSRCERCSAHAELAKSRGHGRRAAEEASWPWLIELWQRKTQKTRPSLTEPDAEVQPEGLLQAELDELAVSCPSESCESESFELLALQVSGAP